MARLAIDFGTSNTVAAWVNCNLIPMPVRFEDDGNTKLPSVAFFRSKEDFDIGVRALRNIEDRTLNARTLPELIDVCNRSSTSIKRNLDDGIALILPERSVVTKKEVISKIFQRIIEKVERNDLQRELVDEIVLTHPVDFSEAQKNILKEAAKMNVPDSSVIMVEEPIAAILGYKKLRGLKGNNFLVYDFGGGTFDVAYVKQFPDSYQCCMRDGIVNCGGIDIDRILYKNLDGLSRQRYNFGVDLDGGKENPELLRRCGEQKICMSKGDSYTFKEMVLGRDGKIKQLDIEYTKEIFEELISPFINQTIDCVKRLINRINELGDSIDAILMVGGSSKLPTIRERLTTIVPASTVIISAEEWDTSVAIGAVVFQNEIFKYQNYYCGYCGTLLNSSMNYCYICGHKTEEIKKLIL